MPCRDVTRGLTMEINRDVSGNVSMVGQVNVYHNSTDSHNLDGLEVNLEGITAGTIGGNLNIVGLLNEYHEETVQPDKKAIKEALEKVIVSKTSGMVRVTAVQVVLDLINSRKTWITISGSPGEGKTTIAYFALQHLSQQGIDVYDIKTPEEYFERKTLLDASVILLNDIFGGSECDKEEVKKWIPAITDILEMQEHDTAQGSATFPLTVILVGRDYILKAASPHLFRFKSVLTGQDNLIDLSRDHRLSQEEKKSILNHHAQKHHVDINDDVVEEVCRMEVPHGFPHCCSMFASLYSERAITDIKGFFSKPLDVLNDTLEALIQDKQIGSLFRTMVRKGGRIVIDDIQERDKRFITQAAANQLMGTYLERDGTTVTFSHASVYESVKSVLDNLASSPW